MKNIFDWSVWVSPLTGRIELQDGYVWQGGVEVLNIEGTPTQYIEVKQASPIVIDVQLDMIALRRFCEQLKQQVDQVISDYLSKYLPKGQLFIGNDQNQAIATQTINVDNLPKLSYAVFPTPIDVLNFVPMPNPYFNPAVGKDWLMSGALLVQSFTSTSDITQTNWYTAITSSFAFAQLRISQLLRRFELAKFLVKSRGINYNWPNPAMLAIPDAIKLLYGAEDTYDFPEATQALDELEPGILKVSADADGNRDGIIRRAIPGTDYVDYDAGGGAEPVYPNANDIALWAGGNKYLISRRTITRDNLPGLTYNFFWKGNAEGRPVETLWDAISELEFNTYKAEVEAQFVAVEGEIAVLTGEVQALGIVSIAGLTMSLVDFLGLIFSDNKSQEQEINNINNTVEQITNTTIQQINQDIQQVNQELQNSNITQEKNIIDVRNAVTSVLEDIKIVHEKIDNNDVFGNDLYLHDIEFNQYFEDKTEDLFNDYVKKPTFNVLPEKVRLAWNHILIGNLLGDAYEIPLDSFNFATRDDVSSALEKLSLPVWTTATRPSNPTIGMIGLNMRIQ